MRRPSFVVRRSLRRLCSAERKRGTSVPPLNFVITSAAVLLSVVIEATAALIQALFGYAFLDGGGDCAGAEGLGEQQAVAGLRATVLENSFRIDQTGDRVAEFRFFVANAVAADDGASGFDHFGEAAGEDAFENFEIAFFREANHGQSGDAGVRPWRRCR